MASETLSDVGKNISREVNNVYQVSKNFVLKQQHLLGNRDESSDD